MKTPYYSSGIKEIVLFEYWFDREVSRRTIHVSKANDLSIDSFLNVAQLDDGIHSLHIRYLDNAQVWSTIYSKFFMKTPGHSSNTKEIVELEYWFDRNTDRTLLELNATNLFVIDSAINTAELSDGLHYIRIRFKDNGGVWSSVYSKCFYKNPSNASGVKEIVAMEYWFDRNTSRNLIAFAGDSLLDIDSVINFSSVSQGNHNLYIRYIDNGGVWSSVINKRVIKVFSREVDSNQIYLLRYWFDQASSNKTEIYFNPRQLIDLDTIINTVSISKGTHKIHYQYLDTAGIWSVVKTDTFVRVSSPIPLFSVNDTDGCTAAQFTFSNSSIDANAYMWYFGDGDSSAQANPTHSYVNPGRYTVTLVAKDVNLSKKNSLIKTGLIHVFAKPTVTIYKNNLFCYADQSGSINFNISGSYAPYKLSFNGGGYDTTKLFSNLVAGTYYSYIKDSNGCVSSYVTQITQPSILKFAYSLKNINCNSDSSGEITLQASGGTAGYRYAIGNGSYQSKNKYTQLKAGSYSIHIRDSNDCAIDTNLTLNQPTALNYTYTFNAVSCFGDSTGRVNITASGGAGRYQYKYNNSAYQDSSIFRKLVAGNYTFTIRDSNQCVASFNTSISQPTKLSIVKSIAAPGPTLQMCYGDSSGIKTIQVIGGTSPYLYQLNNKSFQTNATYSGLKADIYFTTVKDSNGCIDTDSFVINQAPKILVTSSIQTPSCYGDSNAVIQLVANYGYTPYTYQIQNSKQFNTSGKFDHLKAGTYIFNAMDVNGCQTSDTLKVTQPNLLSISPTIKHIYCKGDSSGSITLNAFGGRAPYTYKLGNSSFGNQNQWASLKAGQYTVYIKDANACLASTQITLTEPSIVLSYNTNTSYANCSGNSGVVQVNANGGTPPYRYQMGNSGYQSSNVFSQLSPGNYQIMVKDSLGCIYHSNIVMPANNKLLSMTYDKLNICCDGTNTGEIKLYAAGGNSPYLFSLDNGQFQSSNQFVNISKGTHTFTLKDSNTCTITISAEFNEPSQLTPTVVWTGLVDSSWNNKLNWSPQRLPTSSDSVKITSGLTYYPTLSNSQSVHSIRIDTNAYMRIVVSGRLNIYGVISKVGNIYASGGLVNLYSNTGIPQGDYVSLGVYGQAKMCGEIKLSNSLTINTSSSIDNRGYHLYANGTINNLGYFLGDGSLILQKNNGYQTIQGVGSYSNVELNTPSNYGARIVNDALITDSLKLKGGTLVLGENITRTVGQNNSSKGYIYNINSVISSGNSKPSNLTIIGNAQASVIPNLNVQILGTLTISRPAGVVLGNHSVTYGLDLQSGVIDMNGKNLVLGNINSNLGINTNGNITNRLSSGLLQVNGSSSAPAIDQFKFDTIYSVNFSRPTGIKLGKNCWVKSLASINKGFVDLNGYTVGLS
ncbi:MAG: PKD domain-containing protein, partial [Bacteroidetes bacterium]|nr:PKD domain-containing protein [Bacteroidota bacterium]